MSRRDHPIRSRWPVVTVAIALAVTWVFVQEQKALEYGLLQIMFEDYCFRGALKLAELWSVAPTLISHLFMHSNVEHFRGNMLFFLVFAPAVERAVGSFRFLGLYLAWGVAAALAQVYFSPGTDFLLGASGAISGVMGAYFVLFPLFMPTNWIARIGAWTENPTVSAVGGWIGKIPAFVFVGAWFLLQLRAGFYSVTLEAPYLGAQVAYWAHVGGFAAGALSMAPFLTSKNDVDRPA